MDWRQQRGMTALTVLLLMPVLLAMLGVAVDGALLVRGKIALEGATVSAALAATDAYDRGIWGTERRVVIAQSRAALLARQYLSLNMADADIDSVAISPTAANRVTVSCRYTVRLFFMPIFGINTRTVQATATASKN